MKRATAIVFSALLFTACPVDMWIPIETMPRQSVRADHVQYLDSLPDRPYTVIGIITPPAGEYSTEAEMVKAIRSEAAKHGADAVFIESRSEKEGWHFSGGMWGASGGSGTSSEVRAKAIVWNASPART